MKDAKPHEPPFSPWGTRDTRAILDSIGTVAAGARIYADGVRFVDDVEYWRWLTSEVVSAGRIGDMAIELSDADTIKQWAESKLASGGEGGFTTLLRGRGFEYDFVRERQHDIGEFFKGNLWRRATMAEDRMGIDAIRENVFSGQSETHQLKMAMSEKGARVNLEKYGPGGNQPVDVVDVNERVNTWRQSPQGVAEIARRGDTHPDVRQVTPDQEISDRGQYRVDQARSGSANTHVTFEGAATQIGRGAIIGAVVAVGISGVTNYARFRRGEIDGAEFGDLLLSDSSRGALTGGAIAAVNIPVQLAAHALGVGNPVTIPVMIVLGAGLRYVIDPMFGKGAYADDLREIEVTTRVSAAVARFASSCHGLFQSQRSFLENVVHMQNRARKLNSLSRFTDTVLDAEIERI